MVRRIQAVSGAAFAVFVAMHLINTWAAVAGPELYGALQHWLSLGYQAPVLEWFILSAAAVHAGCAVMRWRRESRGRLPWRARLHRYAGVFLMVFIAGHVTAVRLLPAAYGIRPGFEGVSFSLALLPGYFYPYYLLLGLAGAYHGLNGLALASARLGVAFTLPPRVLYATAGLAGVATAVALLAFGSMLFEVADPWQSDFALLYLRLMGG